MAGIPAGDTGGSLTPEEVTAVKSWTTPEKQSVSLSGEGVRLATGGGISLSLTQAGITVQGKGDMTLEAENIIIVGKQLRMNAKSYIYFKCQGAGIAVLCKFRSNGTLIPKLAV